MELNKYLVISRHVEEKCGGRTSVKILEDIFESFIGALYLDFNEEELEHPRLDFYSGLGFQICQVFIINIIVFHLFFLIYLLLLIGLRLLMLWLRKIFLGFEIKLYFLIKHLLY